MRRWIHPALLAFAIVQGADAAALKEAEVSRVYNDVRVLQPQRQPTQAQIGEVIRGQTAVATGAKSRAELKFPDQTLSRLGSNTVFRLDQGARELELRQGVILLQVPKSLGGAKIKTAAVTAAVTGTTVMLEYQPNGYIKAIVLEGEMDLFLKDRPSQFRTIKAGDMIITRPDADVIPVPVQVDLQRLMQTLKLITDPSFTPLGNSDDLGGAISDQQTRKADGELVDTAYVVPGRGTRVIFNNEVRREILKNTEGGPEQPDFIPGTTTITEDTVIDTGLGLTAENDLVGVVTALGRPFEPQADGGFDAFVFGREPSFEELDERLQAVGTLALFWFEDLFVTGVPTVDSSNGPRNLILAAGNDALLDGTEGAFAGVPQWVLDDALDALVIASGEGGIEVSNFSLSGTAQDVIFNAPSPMGDVVARGLPGQDPSVGPFAIQFPEGTFGVFAGGDVAITDGAVVEAAEVAVETRASQIRARTGISLMAETGVSITDSSQLRALSETDPLDIQIASTGGDVSVDASLIQGRDLNLRADAGDVTVRNATLAGETVRARALGPDGRLILGGSVIDANQSIPLFAEGSNGQILFNGPVTLDSPESVLAAQRVTIAEGVGVTVTQPDGLSVFTDVPEFNQAGFGAFRDTSRTQIPVAPQPFSAAPSPAP
jgi:hypothetical protein